MVNDDAVELRNLAYGQLVRLDLAEDGSVAAPQAPGGLLGRDGAAGLTDRVAECAVLDRLVEAVLVGESRALVVHGEPGIGKTALLDYLARRAQGCRVVRAAGVEPEMELAFAGLHQLCAPLLDRLGALPVPQAEALRTAFGMSAGPPPDRFLVGLAVLSLLSEIAAERPLVCLVDDQHWLDRASAQVLAFAARRLGAESVGLVFGTRVAGGDLAGLPGLLVQGLQVDAARALLDSVLPGPIDASVLDQIVAETRGNPLAILEMPKGLSPAELAGGFGLPGAVPLAESIEEWFGRRVGTLPEPTRRLLLLASADPSGDPALMRRATGRLGIPADAAAPAAEARLAEFGAQVVFRHPLVRSAVYRSAPLHERQDVHRALAEATDRQTDPDRRAWHLAQAAPGPAEDVAAELERSAGRAQARGGLAAASAFLDRAAMLTPEPAGRARRLLAAARAKRDAGALDAALQLLAAAEPGPLDPMGIAQMEHLRGQISLERRRGGDAVRQLVSAARHLEPLDAKLARHTHLEAVGAAIWAGDLDRPGMIGEAAAAARAAPPGPDPACPADVVLDALAIRLTQGYAAAAPDMTRALGTVLALNADAGLDVGDWLWLTGARAGGILALEVWDADSWYALTTRHVQVAREAGALVHLQFALNFLAANHIAFGELSTAAEVLVEARLVADAIGNRPVAPMTLAAWQGREPETVELIGATMRDATAGGMGMLATFADYAYAVLYNGLGRYDAAREAAQRAFERDQFGYGLFIVPELAEAASRTGDVALLSAALEWLAERTRVTPTDWALGVHARVQALLGDGEEAEGCYRESILRLGSTRVRTELARSHLLYGEWLRRKRRRAEAREQLRTACGMLEAMGAEGFAERARRELLATGYTARKRNDSTRDQELTAQEAQIARLARDGLSNPEIAARLFISARTVKYHLRKVFAKLDITSRSQLGYALPGGSAAEPQPSRPAAPPGPSAG
jgi:DNA-binding CsgD family transcriptional regulator